MDTIKSTQEWQLEAERLLDSAIELNLSLSVEERIEAHENARQLAQDLKMAGAQLFAKP